MGIETIAAIGALAGGLGSLKTAFSKPETSKAALSAESDLNKQTEDDKRKRALQAAQRKPVETFLTGGQGLTGTANSGAKLG